MRPNSAMLFGRISVSMGQPRANLARSPAPVPFPAASVLAAHSPNTETEVNMAIINLRDFYPYYTMDSFIEVPDEVAEAMAEFDREDGIEHSALFIALSPCEIYERKVTMQELHAAISSLPDKQAKRIYAHFVLGMSKTDIARAEGVDEKVVRLAIERGLRNMEKFLKNNF